MNKSYLLFASTFVSILLLLHFVPIKQVSGVIEVNPGGPVTCMGYSTEIYDYRLIANGTSVYTNTKDSFATTEHNQNCDYRPVKLRLFVL